ncbi:MAG: hypothetical protein ABI284_03190 [Nitrosospira sp.]
MSETRSGRKCEIFEFVQGYSTEAKVGRRINGTADVATFGLREFVSKPVEAVSSGDEMAWSYSRKWCMA